MNIMSKHLAMAPSIPISTTTRETAKPRWTLLDYWLLLMIFGPMLGSFYPPETYFNTGWGAASTIGPLTPILLVLISSTIALLYFRMKVDRRTFLHAPLIYAFVIYVFVSLIWVAEPQAAFQRALRLLPIVGLGLVLPQWYGIDRFFRMMSIAVTMAAVSSIFMAVAIPSLGIGNLGQGYENAWRGALGHKNVAGIMFNLGLLMSFGAYRKGLIATPFFAVIAMLCTTMIVKSQSLTPLVSVTVAALLALVIQTCRNMRGSTATLAALTAILGLILLVSFAILLPDATMTLFGRDMTFTGRTDIWAAVLDLIADHPYFGHGYNFWITDAPARDYVIGKAGYLPAHSHNSWLDLLLQLGLPAFFCVSAIMVTNLIRASVNAMTSDDPLALFPLSVTIFLLIYSMTEVAFTEPAVNGWLWLTLATTMLNMMRSGSAQVSDANQTSKGERDFPR